MKYLRPLYRALFRSKMGKQAAVDTFQEAKDTYHPIAKKMLAQDLQDLQSS
jgi:leukotriene-A4 hydrolase